MPVKISNSFTPYSPVGQALNEAITSYTNSIPTYNEVQEGRVNANKADAPALLGDRIRALYGASGPEGRPLSPQMVQDQIGALAEATAMSGDVGKLGDLMRVVVANAANPESVRMIDRAQQGAGQAYSTTETGFNIAQQNEMTKAQMQQDGAMERARMMANKVGGINPTTGQPDGLTPTQRMEKEKQAKGRDAFQSILDDMALQYDALDKNGGLVSNEGDILNNVLARTASSSTGQAIGGYVGTKNQTYRDSINSRLPLLKQAVMAATGMSAKQMDSNVEMQAFMKALSDPRQSKEAILGTLNTLSRLYGKGGMAPAAAPEASNTSAEIVPSGGQQPIRKEIGGKIYVNYTGDPNDWEEE